MRWIPFVFLFFLACTSAGDGVKTGTVRTQDGLTLSYDLYPSKGPSVILLHMLGRTKEDWRAFASELNEKGYAVVAIDMRGHGKSEGNLKGFVAGDFINMAAYDVAAAKQVLASAGADTTNLAVIGASIGANTALNYGITDPDVKTVVLLSPGLDYRGVKTEDAATRYAGSVLIVASKEDEYSAQSAERLASLNTNSKLVLYDGAGHGTNMFVKKELGPTILVWLEKNI